MAEGIKIHSKGRHVCGRNAVVEDDLFKFRGNGGSVGVVRITEPMCPMMNYYEYEIICKGGQCAIGIGLGEFRYPLNRMPGWNRNGIGWHADDGRLFHEHGYGKQFGPLCTEGDRMGCGVDFDTDAGQGFLEVFFTKNGVQVGDNVRMKRPVYGLYPLIGMHSAGEVVRYLGHWHRQPKSLLEPMIVDCSPSNKWMRSNGVRYLEDGLTLEYTGDGLNNQDCGIAQANFKVDRQNHYFEMEIVSSGVKGWLALGLAVPNYPLHRHPGWDDGSVGYHADNGHLYKERGHGEPFGPTCTDGDVMGCGVIFPKGVSEDIYPLPAADSQDSDTDTDEIVEDALFVPERMYSDEDAFSSDYSDEDDYMFGGGRRRLQMMRRNLQVPSHKAKVSSTSSSLKCTVYFTKNSETVGETEFYLPKEGLYPVVAMMTPGEKIKVNLQPLTG